jgi:xanthine dehydrogenase YagT iron-sulfur-binding subunit
MQLVVNGRTCDLALAPETTLLDALRGPLELTGTKRGCDRGECGACSVLVDDVLTYSCLTLAHGCAGSRVTTVEGLADGATLSALQAAFVAHDAAQCGFCTPGQLIAAHALLASIADPTDDDIREGMSGNLCRCGTYPRIASAIRAVARR